MAGNFGVADHWGFMCWSCLPSLAQVVLLPIGSTKPPVFWRSLVGTETSGQNGDRVSGLLPGNGCAVDARFRVIGLLAKNKTEAVSCFA